MGSPANKLAVINMYHFAFQKKFGQNFLIDANVVEKIVREAGVTKEDFVLEIGPGIGTMTQLLCENAREVTAVEIDKNLIPILRDTLSGYDKRRKKTAADQLKWWQTCRIILQRRLSWDYLKAVFRLTVLRLWCRKKLHAGCR